MKRNAAYIFTLILYLLIACTILSAKIEEEMQTQVITTDYPVEKNKSGNIQVSMNYLYQDANGGTHLFYVEEGTRWVRGNISKELSPMEYTAGKDANMQPVVFVPANRDWSFVAVASRFPLDGRGVEICDSINFVEDQYLLIYPDGVPAYEKLPDRVELISQTEDALLLNMQHTRAPFIENQAKSSLWRLESENWKIYSLGDYETFQGCIPKIILLAILVAVPVLLWLVGLIWMLLSDKGKVPVMIFALGSLLCLGGVIYLISQIDLPSSLMPVNSIFDFEHYRICFQEIEHYLQ